MTWLDSTQSLLERRLTMGSPEKGDTVLEDGKGKDASS
jgi:hypothetical protein